MPRIPRAFALRAVAIVVALITAKMVGSDLATLHRNAHDLGARRTVVFARHDLALGDRVTGADLGVATRYSEQVPASALRSTSLAVGHIVIVPVVADAPLLTANLSGTNHDDIDAAIPAGMRALRVADPAGLDPPVGSVVDVIASFQAADARAATASIVVARGAIVLRGDGYGTAGDASTSRTVAPGNTPLGVTLVVTEPEARQIAFASVNGTLTLALAPPETACCTPASP